MTEHIIYGIFLLLLEVARTWYRLHRFPETRLDEIEQYVKGRHNEKENPL